MDRALLIFSKKPELGKVKTRLAKDIGDDKALQIFRQLLFYTFDVAERAGVYTIACFTEEDQITLDTIPYSDFYQQESGDLGDKMFKGFEHAKKQGFNKLVVIGTDCADLTKEIIQEAYQKLEDHDVVIGPAKDGGYYLLGMKEPKQHLFENIDWSTEKVLDQTIESIKSKNETFCLLEELSDIDNIEDLKASNNQKIKDFL